MNLVSRALRGFTTRDLVIIAIIAALGVAVKPVVVPIAHLVAAPLFIPAGALAGGLYMMWLVVGMGLVGKRGTPTLIALVQGLLVMFTGVVGSHGAMSLLSYTAPGIVMDLGLLLIGHRACCVRCCVLAGMLANVTGSLMVNLIFFRLPPIPLALALCTAALSGGLGGALAWQVIKLLRRHRIGVVRGCPSCGEQHDEEAERPASDAAGASARGRPTPGRAASTQVIGGALVLAAFSLFALAGCASGVEDAAGGTPATPSSSAGIAFTCGVSGESGTLVAADAFAAAGGRTLVVFLDGFGFDQYLAAGSAGRIPHLGKLDATKAATVYPTITPVTFAAMVSGEDPATTGVRDRKTHRLSCPSIFGWAEARGLTDGEVFAAAKQVLRCGQPDFMLVHFRGIDDTSHEYGPFAGTTRRRVHELDGMAGELMERWDGQVIVVADHGQHTLDHPAEGEGHGEHGAFRSEDLFIPLLVRGS